MAAAEEEFGPKDISSRHQKDIGAPAKHAMENLNFSPIKQHANTGDAQNFAVSPLRHFEGDAQQAFKHFAVGDNVHNHNHDGCCSTAAEENMDLEELRDQVKVLRQHQVYQVQMLNFLHFQLSVLAKNSNGGAAVGGGQIPIYQAAPGLNSYPGVTPGISHMIASASSRNSSTEHQPTSEDLQATESEFTTAENRKVSAKLERPIDLVPPSMRFLSSSSDGTGGNSDDIFEEKQSSSLDRHQQQRAGLVGKDFMTRIHAGSHPFTSLNLFQQHRGVHPDHLATMKHSMPPAHRPDELPAAGKHICKYCYKSFGSDSALQIHFRSHTGERPYKCNICASRFSTKGNLKVHFVRHKERYPNIEMNPFPVPEYLDNVPTSTGLPYGMSIIQEENESREVRDVTIPTELPIRDQARPLQSLDNRRTPPQNSPLQSVGLSPKTADTNKSDSSYFKSSMFPFLPDPITPALPTTPDAASAHQSNPDDTAQENEDIDPEKCDEMEGLDASETSKLQQLVEQIDKRKTLEKNECHICHRILSCQSALKLHYRTHTGKCKYTV